MTARKKLLFTVIVIIFSLASVECGLHLIYWIKSLFPGNVIDYKLTLTPYKDKEWAVELFTEIHDLQKIKNKKYAPYVGWRRSEYHGKWINIDADGVRRTWNPKTNAQKRYASIYFFGGSSAWGMGARDDYTIPSYLSKLLNVKDSNFFVYNYGETSYDVTQSIIQLVLLLKDDKKPDHVIFYVGANDISGAYLTGKAGGNNDQEEIKKRVEREECSFFNIIKQIQYKILIVRDLKKIIAYFQPPNKMNENAHKYYDVDLLKLGDSVVEYFIKSAALVDNLSKVYGFKYMFFWQPSIFTKSKLTEEEAKSVISIYEPNFITLYRYVTKEITTKNIPHFFDLSGVLSNKSKTCFVDWCHTSEEANEIIAVRISSIFFNNQNMDDNSHQTN